MRYIVFLLYAGITGTDSAEFVEFDDSVTNAELDAEAWERALNHAGMYGIYPIDEMPEDHDEEEADSWTSDSYSESIEGYWEEYDPEKHDGKIVGKGPAFANYKK